MAPRPYSPRPDDRALDPRRRPISPDAGSGQYSAPTSRVEYDSGIRRPVKDLGWLNRHAKYVSEITYDDGDEEGADSTLTARGEHPTKGPFKYSTGFADRQVMRAWVDSSPRRWNNAFIQDHLRDGGGLHEDRKLM